MRCVSCGSRLRLVTGGRGVPDYARCPVCGGTYDVPQHTGASALLTVLAVGLGAVGLAVLGILLLFFASHCGGPAG